MVAIISVIFSFFLIGSMSYLVCSSENWIEVDRFTGGSWYGGTRSFTMNGSEWRIRWNYEPNIDVNKNSNSFFHLSVIDVSDKTVNMALGNSKPTGSMYFFKQGEFYLKINGLYVKNYTVIIEQNID